MKKTNDRRTNVNNQNEFDDDDDGIFIVKEPLLFLMKYKN